MESRSLNSDILNRYGLIPINVEQIGKVKKVDTRFGNFALKELPQGTGRGFIQYIQTLYQMGFNRIIPIQPALDGSYVVNVQGKDYYLQPWLAGGNSGDRTEISGQLFRELARMHSYSVREVRVSKEELARQYEAAKGSHEEQKQFLERFVDYCEKQWYMSPFELQFCTYYHSTMQAVNFSLGKLDEWRETSRETGSVRMCIAHGRVSPSHFIADERGNGHFINFEKAVYSVPYHDLIGYFYRSLRSYPVMRDDFVEDYETYQRHFPLREEEKHLMLSHLAWPGELIRCAKRYIDPKSSLTEREHVKALQRSYWQMKNIEFVAVKILESGKKIEAGKEESHT